MATKKVFVICKDYNGYKDVPFMMSSDDYRAGSENYPIVDPAPKYSHKEKTLTTNRGTFEVCSDWSLRFAFEVA